MTEHRLSCSIQYSEAQLREPLPETAYLEDNLET